MSWTPREGTFRSMSWLSVSVTRVKCYHSLGIIRTEEKRESAPLHFNVVMWLEAALQNAEGEGRPGHRDSKCGQRQQTGCACASPMCFDLPIYCVLHSNQRFKKKKIVFNI